MLCLLLARRLVRDLRRSAGPQGQSKLERFSARLDRSVNHLTIGLITTGLIVGTSIALTVEGGPRLIGFPLFGALGFLSSVAMGLWWIVVTRRRG
jgi:ubiquinone biosynthesis protein